MLLFLRVTLMWDFLRHPVQVRTDSVVFNLMDDGEYWNHRPFLRHFFSFSFSFLNPVQTCWLLFTTMYADRAVVLQYVHSYHMCLIWHCGNPIMVTVSMWLSQRDHCNMLRINLISVLRGFHYLDIAEIIQSSSFHAPFTVETFKAFFLWQIWQVWTRMVVIPVYAVYYFWVCELCAYLHMWLQNWKVLWNGMSWPLSAAGAVNSTWFGGINAVPSFVQTPVERSEVILLGLIHTVTRPAQGILANIA